MFDIGKKKTETVNLTESFLRSIDVTRRILEIYYGFPVVFTDHLEIEAETVKKGEPLNMRRINLTGQVAIPDTCEQHTPTHFALLVTLFREKDPDRWVCKDVTGLILYTPKPNHKSDTIVYVSCSVRVEDGENFHVSEYMNDSKNRDFRTRITRIGHDISDRRVESVLPPKAPSKRV